MPSPFPNLPNFMELPGPPPPLHNKSNPFHPGIGISLDAVAWHTQGAMPQRPKKLQKAGTPLCFYII
jgi:hypothetical protein